MALQTPSLTQNQQLIQSLKFILPHTRQAGFSHTENVFTGRFIAKGNKPTLPLNTGLPLDPTQVFLSNRKQQPTHSLAQILQSSPPDGLIILHRGQVVFEHYAPRYDASGRHILFSATKSFAGLIAAEMAAEKSLDLSKSMSYYLPELKGTGYAHVCVQDVLDMRVGLAASEKFNPYSLSIGQMMVSVGMIDRRINPFAKQNYQDVLLAQQQIKDHHGDFQYMTINTELIGWLIERLTEQPLAHTISERFWQKIGAESDAWIASDPQTGHDMAGLGMAANLRDMARMGLLVNQVANGQSTAINPWVIHDLRHNTPLDSVQDALSSGDMIAKTIMPKRVGYHNFCYVDQMQRSAIYFQGMFAQTLWMDPSSDVVLAVFSSDGIIPIFNYKLWVQVARATANYLSALD